MASDLARTGGRPADLDLGLLIARIALVLVFPAAAYYKLVAPDRAAAYLGGTGLPAPTALVWLVVLVEFGLPLLILLGIRTRWAALALLLYCVATALLGHRFWTFDVASQYGTYFNNLMHFLKNVGMAGGFGLLALVGPGRYAVDARG